MSSWISAAVLGIFMGRCGWLMHEAGHHSVTGMTKVDRFLQSIIYGVGCGMSASWWSSQHNRHHAMPQRLKHDVDLDTLPLMAFNSRVVNPQRPHRAQNFFVRYQSVLFLALDTLLVAWMWKLYLHPRYCVQKGKFVDLALMACHYSLGYFFGWKIYLLSVWLAAIYIFGNFAMSHTHLPVTDGPLHWVEYALHHTANITSQPVTNWWMGYLNFQIEHHLFPAMPQYRHQEISARVAKFAKEHELPYVRVGYFEALGMTLSNLSKVSKEIEAMKAPAKA
jgi:acyl-CoA 6-desaturase (Delta-6 desaturase)